MRPRPDAQPERDVLEHAHVPEQGVVLEHEPDVALAHRLVGRVFAVEVDRALIGRLQAGDDAEERRLARPGGPEQRHQLAAGHVQAHVVERDEPAERLAQIADLDAHAMIPPVGVVGLDRLGRGLLLLPFDQGLEGQGDDREQREHRRHREAGRERVLVVQDLDVQRQRVGLAPDVAGDHRHRAELAHRARVAEDEAVQQAPLDVGQRDPEERLPAAGAEHDGRFLLLGPLLLHQRNQLARHERRGHERRGQHDARAPRR